ncbi:MAG TPA: hypothetical protein VHL08_04020 [Dongiaceae bacterium]|jgi:hypothetical protein|nr:hypothetical protein [Dongiaceae bacterium]
MSVITTLISPALPLPNDRMHVSDQGDIHLGKDGSCVDFRFLHRGLPCIVQARVGRRGPILTLWGLVGKLPYSAEDAASRQAILSIVRETRRLPHTRLVIAQAAMIYVIGSYAMPAPWLPINLIGVACALLYEVTPHLSLIAEILPPPRVALSLTEAA